MTLTVGPLRPSARQVRTAPAVTLVVLAALVLTPLVLLAAPARADAPDPRDSDGDDPMAVDLIYRSAVAPRTIGYTGTQYVSAWSSMDPTAASASAVMTLEHRPGQGTRVGVPNQQASILNWRDGTAWLAGGSGTADLLVSAYDVDVAGSGSVAGRAAFIVEARRDDGSVAARLWLDQETSLTLRRETFDLQGALLNASAFVDITMTQMRQEDVQIESSTPTSNPAGSGPSGSGPSGSGPSGSSSSASALDWSDIEDLRDSGWHCPDALSDGLVLYEAHRYDDVVHLSYSDGVMTVSVFEQPGRLDEGALENYDTLEIGGGTVYAKGGPPARYVWSSGGQVVTVVSEAPGSVIDDLAAQMPPDTLQTPEPKEEDGFLDRIVRGAKKVGGFLNPFD